MQIIQGAITIALFILILGGLVLLHELGHFVTARLFHIRVHEFGIGFPPRAKVLRAKGETLYTLNWLPIGGFVRLEGEDGDSDDPRSFGAARLWKQLVVLVAGVAMNLLLALVIFVVVGLAVPVAGVRFWEVQAGSPAATAGLLPGDAIVSVNGEQSITGNVLTAIRAHSGETVTLGVMRDGARIDVPVTLRSTAQQDDSHGALGISGQTRPFEAVSFGGRSLGEAVAVGGHETVAAFGMIWDGLGQLVTSVATNPTKAPPVAGPIGIASMVGDVFWQMGPIMLLYLAALLSANLALVNVLPIPPFDGGRMFVLLLKSVLSRGRGVLRRVGINVGGPSSATAVTAERLVYLVGFMALFAFLIWISVFDVARLGSGTTP